MTALAPRARVRRAMTGNLRPPPPMRLSEWADRHRYLDSSTSSEPGQWRTSRVPYLREIMDCLSPEHPAERVVFQKGAQCGASEAAINWVGFIIDHMPGPVLVVHPTIEMAETWSKERLSKMIRSTPAVRDKIGDPQGRAKRSGDAVRAKEFPGGLLALAGSNSGANLRQRPIKYLVLDDLDEFHPDAAGQGDPVELAEARTTTFASNRKILMASTPTTSEASRIAPAFEASDQRYFYVPCPECDTYQVLKWSQVTWPRGRPEDAEYACEGCGSLLADRDKEWMLPRGEWRATSEPEEPGLVGFHLSALYSPHGWKSWGQCAVQFYRAGRDPAKLKPFVNTVLGETWQETQASSLRADELYDRLEHFHAECPSEVAAITQGVDVQDDCLVVETVGWGVGEESWSLDYRTIWGDPSGRAVWEDLHDFLHTPWQHGSGIELRPVAACIDSGGSHTQTVYDFCRPRHDRRIWPVKGKDGQDRPVWPKKPTKVKNKKVPLYLLGVDTAKTTIYARLRLESPGPGYCHFPVGRDPSYFDELTAEVRRVKYHRGHARYYWWKPERARNEALDCRVYAYAALLGWMENAGRQALAKARRRIDEQAGRKRPSQRQGGQPRRAPRQKRRPSKSSWFDR